MKINHLSLFSILSLLILSPAGVAVAQPLEEIMAEALQGSQSLAADRATLEARREAVFQARSAGLPEVAIKGFTGASDTSYDPGADGDLLLDRFGVSGFDSLGIEPATSSTGISLTAQQTLFAGGQVHHSIRQAKAGVRAAEAGFVATREEAIFEIVSAYLDVIRADEQVAAISQSLMTLTSQEDAVKGSFELGRATKTDVASVAAQRAGQEAQLALARSRASAARLKFQALTGLVPQAFVLSALPPVWPDDIAQIIATGTTHNPALESAAALVEASDAKLRSARGKNAPSIRLAGGLSYAEGNVIAGDTIEDASIQLQMSVPLFSGGRIASDIREAKAELRSSRFSQADLRRRLDASLRAAYGDVLAAQTARRAAESQLEARTMAFEGVGIEADLGQRTTLDVLDAEDDLLTARFASIDARLDEHLAIYNLHRLMGTLGESFDLAGEGTDS